MPTRANTTKSNVGTEAAPSPTVGDTVSGMFHHYDRRRGLLRYAAISIGIFIPAVVVYLYLLNQDDFVGSIGRFLAFMFGGVSGATALCVSGRWLYLVLSKDRLVGPPPITPPQADDYGPQSATSQANAVIDELGYKPNA